MHLMNFEKALTKFNGKKLISLTFLSCTLIKLIFERNFFEFNRSIFMQKIGCAMKSQFSPEICDIFLHGLENKSYQKISKYLK